MGSTRIGASGIVNNAVRADLAAFEGRAAEGIYSYEELLNDLKAHDKL